MQGVVVTSFLISLGFAAAAPLPQTAPNPRSIVADTSTVAGREHFLMTAAVESVAGAPKGVTHSLKATLSDGRLTHAAQIQTIDLHMPLFRGVDGSQELDFSDSWKYNVAAYRLSKLLGLTYMTPVSVIREYQGKPAAFTWWVDDVIMDDRDRIRNGIQPPDMVRWNHQMDIIRLFDQLIYNMDRSQENILIGSDWSVWMIDHTRAFRKWQTLRNPLAITGCNPDLLRRLEHLRREDLDREEGDLLTPEQISALLVRRDLILAKLAEYRRSAL